MWTLFARWGPRVLLRDDLALGARTAMPQLTQLRATSTAVSDYYKKQQEGRVTEEIKTDASRDLLSLSQQQRLSSSEVEQVRQIQAKVEAGKPLAEADVKEIGAIVDRLEARLTDPDAAVVEKANAHWEKGYDVLHVGKFREAESELRQSLALCPPDRTRAQGNLHAYLGKSLDGQGRKQEALEQYHAALKLTPNEDWAPEARKELLIHARIRYDVGNAHYEQGRYAEAEAEWRKAIATCPDDEVEHQANLHNALGLALQRQGKRDEALAAFQRSLELSPNGEYHDVAGEHLQELQEPSMEKANGYFEKGKTAYEQGQYLQAEAEARQALALTPPGETEFAAAMHKDVGLALEEQGRTDEAMQEYKTFLRMNPQGNKAQEIRERLIDHAREQFKKGDALYEKGQFAEAEAEWRKAIAACPDDADEHQANLHNALGLALQRQGKRDEALTAFQRSLELSPNGEYHDVAGEHIQELQEPSMEKANGYFEKGKTAYEQGQYLQAEAETRQALALTPPGETEFAAAMHKDVGLALEAQGRNDEAMQEYKTFLRMNPQGNKAQEIRQYLVDNASQQYDKGNVLYEQKNYAGAEAEWRKAIAACPDDEVEHQANLHNALGLALEKQGKRDEAIAAFQRSLELSPGGEYHENARQHLKDLEAPPAS